MGCEALWDWPAPAAGAWGSQRCNWEIQRLILPFSLPILMLLSRGRNQTLPGCGTCWTWEVGGSTGAPTGICENKSSRFFTNSFLKYFMVGKSAWGGHFETYNLQGILWMVIFPHFILTLYPPVLNFHFWMPRVITAERFAGLKAALYSREWKKKKKKKEITKGSALKNAFIISLSSVLLVCKQPHTEQGMWRDMLDLPGSMAPKEFHIP